MHDARTRWIAAVIAVFVAAIGAAAFVVLRPASAPVPTVRDLAKSLVAQERKQPFTISTTTETVTAGRLTSTKVTTMSTDVQAGGAAIQIDGRAVHLTAVLNTRAAYVRVTGVQGVPDNTWLVMDARNFESMAVWVAQNPAVVALAGYADRVESTHEAASDGRRVTHYEIGVDVSQRNAPLSRSGSALRLTASHLSLQVDSSGLPLQLDLTEQSVGSGGRPLTSQVTTRNTFNTKPVLPTVDPIGAVSMTEAYWKALAEAVQRA